MSFRAARNRKPKQDLASDSSENIVGLAASNLHSDTFVAKTTRNV
jgi:hypothetical protein